MHACLLQVFHERMRAFVKEVQAGGPSTSKAATAGSNGAPQPSQSAAAFKAKGVQPDAGPKTKLHLSTLAKT